MKQTPEHVTEFLHADSSGVAHPFSDQGPKATIPDSQYEPFERRVLKILREVLTEVGVFNDLTNLGVNPDEVTGAFTSRILRLTPLPKTFSSIPLAPHDPGLLTEVVPGELTKPFSESLHPLKLGLLLGIRIRERYGLGERALLQNDEEPAFSTIELVHVPLRRGKDTLDGAMNEVFGRFVERYKRYIGQSDASDPLDGQAPLGFSNVGFYAIARITEPYVFFNRESRTSDLNRLFLTRVADDPSMDEEILAQLTEMLFRTGIELGIELRRRDGIRYRHPERPRRSARAFYVTHGFDVGQRLIEDGWESFDPKYRLKGTFERKAGKTFNSFKEEEEKEKWLYLKRFIEFRDEQRRDFRLQRTADYFACLSSQGARDLTLWPLFSNMMVGDFALFELRAFVPPSQELQQCDASPDNEACALDESNGERCAMHLAAKFASDPPEFPGYEKAEVTLHEGKPMAGRLVGIGLVTESPDWLRSDTGMAAWQGKVGFFRPLPVELESSSVSQLPEAKEMAILQFDSPRRRFDGNVSFDARSWSSVLKALEEGIQAELSNTLPSEELELELELWRSDLMRLQLCSENLRLGASMSSLSVLSPDFYSPLFLRPLNPAVPKAETNSRIWFKALSRDGLSDSQREHPTSLSYLPGVISRWSDSSYVREEMELREPTLFRPLGVHERPWFAARVKERIEQLKDSRGDNDTPPFGLIVGTVTNLPAFTKLFGTRLRLDVNLVGEEAISNAELLTLPLDPAWTSQRPIWRFTLDGDLTLYLALVYPLRAAMEASVIQSLCELRHHPDHRTAELNSALGIGPGTQPSRKSNARRSGFSGRSGEVTKSIKRFTGNDGKHTE